MDCSLVDNLLTITSNPWDALTTILVGKGAPFRVKRRDKTPTRTRLLTLFCASPYVGVDANYVSGPFFDCIFTVKIIPSQRPITSVAGSQAHEREREG